MTFFVCFTRMEILILLISFICVTLKAGHMRSEEIIMTISVFMDDYRTCPSGYVLAEDIDQCIALLETNRVDHLSLDHDLVSKTRNGLMLVQYMVRHHLYANRITIHSANAAGSKAMYRHFKQAQEDFEMPKSIKVILKPMPLHASDRKMR